MTSSRRVSKRKPHVLCIRDFAPGLKRKHHILCIDDYAPGLEVRKAILEKWDYSVSTAATGEEGLAFLERNTVDAIIVDYSLPGINGGVVVSTVKADWPDVRAIMLSGNPRVPYNVRDSADVFLRKGDPNERLRSVLIDLLEPLPRRIATRVAQRTRKLMSRATATLRTSRKLFRERS
jgi:CheY-like chemotaxis protein